MCICEDGLINKLKKKKKKIINPAGKGWGEILLNVCDKSQRAICTSCWWFWITILYTARRPSQFCEGSAMLTKCVTDAPRWLCDSLWKVIQGILKTCTINVVC